MKTNLKAEFHNTYFLQLIEAATGKIKQEVEAHNVVVNNMFSNDYMTGSSWTSPALQINSIVVGSGSGTPAKTDKDLFTSLWNLQATKTYNFDTDYKGITVTLTATFPASSSYVGKVTEVGMEGRQYGSYANRNGIVTHSLLQDAEGNPITIDKTDLDELIVTATMHFTMSGNGFELLPLYNSWLGRYFWGNAIHLCDTYFSLARTFKGYLGHFADYHSEEGVPDLDLTLTPSPTYDKSSMKFTATNARILADKGNTHYYNALVLNNFGYWPLPNPDIFPYYDFENINIGIGDGVTTAFKNPLNYFVKDTDRVYVNDVLLTRGVDYTIDNANNASLLTELSAGNFAVCYSDKDDAAITTANSYPIFKACDQASFAFTDTGNKFSATAPLFITFEEEQIINTLRLAGFNRKRTNYSYVENLTSASFKLSYSTDGEIYEEILTTGLFNAYTGATFSFDNITAKYFKLELVEEPYLAYNDYYVLDTIAICYPTCNEPFLGYVGDPNITFTNPPAADAVIKMTVQMDRPFKNSNYVIDVTGDITLSV